MKVYFLVALPPATSDDSILHAEGGNELPPPFGEPTIMDGFGLDGRVAARRSRRSSFVTSMMPRSTTSEAGAIVCEGGYDRTTHRNAARLSPLLSKATDEDWCCIGKQRHCSWHPHRRCEETMEPAQAKSRWASSLREDAKYERSFQPERRSLSTRQSACACARWLRKRKSDREVHYTHATHRDAPTVDVGDPLEGSRECVSVSCDRYLPARAYCYLPRRNSPILHCHRFFFSPAIRAVLTAAARCVTHGQARWYSRPAAEDNPVCLAPTPPNQREKEKELGVVTANRSVTEAPEPLTSGQQSCPGSLACLCGVYNGTVQS